MIDNHLPDAAHVSLDAREAIGETLLCLWRQVFVGLRCFLPSCHSILLTTPRARRWSYSLLPPVGTRLPRQQAPFGFFPSQAQCPAGTSRATISRSLVPLLHAPPSIPLGGISYYDEAAPGRCSAGTIWPRRSRGSPRGPVARARPHPHRAADRRSENGLRQRRNAAVVKYKAFAGSKGDHLV